MDEKVIKKVRHDNLHAITCSAILIVDAVLTKKKKKLLLRHAIFSSTSRQLKNCIIFLMVHPLWNNTNTCELPYSQVDSNDECDLISQNNNSLHNVFLARTQP